MNVVDLTKLKANDWPQSLDAYGCRGNVSVQKKAY